MPYQYGWAHHRDAKPDSMVERLSTWLNPENRRIAREEERVADRQYIESLPSIGGGQTEPPEKLSAVWEPVDTPPPPPPPRPARSEGPAKDDGPDYYSPEFKRIHVRPDPSDTPDAPADQTLDAWLEFGRHNWIWQMFHRKPSKGSES